jgi:hypothetical protein
VVASKSRSPWSRTINDGLEAVDPWSVPTCLKGRGLASARGVTRKVPRGSPVEPDRNVEAVVAHGEALVVRVEEAELGHEAWRETLLGHAKSAWTLRKSNLEARSAKITLLTPSLEALPRFEDLLRNRVEALCRNAEELGNRVEAHGKCSAPPVTTLKGPTKYPHTTCSKVDSPFHPRACPPSSLLLRPSPVGSKEESRTFPSPVCPTS